MGYTPRAVMASVNAVRRVIPVATDKTKIWNPPATESSCTVRRVYITFRGGVDRVFDTEREAVSVSSLVKPSPRFIH